MIYDYIFLQTSFFFFFELKKKKKTEVKYVSIFDYLVHILYRGGG